MEAGGAFTDGLMCARTMSSTPRSVTLTSPIVRCGAVALGVLAALGAPVLVACRRELPPRPDPAAADPASPAASVGSIALPASSLGAVPDVRADATRVYATKSALYVDEARVADGPRSDGYAAKDRRASGSLELTELSRRLEGKGEVRIYADTELPALALTQIVFSARVAGPKSLLLMTNGGAGVRALPLDLSSPKVRCRRGPPPPPGLPPLEPEDCDRGLALELVVTARGVVVFARDVRLGAGCAEPGSDLSVTGHDAAPLRACLARAGDGVPAPPTITFSAAGEAKIGDLVRVIDALRSGEAPLASIRLGMSDDWVARSSPRW